MMPEMEIPDLTIIVNKLREAGIALCDSSGNYGGYFIISKHKNLLTEPELKFWLSLLHSAMPHTSIPCDDDIVHGWGFSVFND